MEKKVRKDNVVMCISPLEIVFLLMQASVNSLWLIAYYIDSDISLNWYTLWTRGNIFEIIFRIAWLPTCPYLLNILFLVSAQMLFISKWKFSKVNTRSVFDLLLCTSFFYITCSRTLCTLYAFKWSKSFIFNFIF